MSRSSTTRPSSSRESGPATLMLAYDVVTGVTCTCHCGWSVCSQDSSHAQMAAAPEDVVLIR
ncbi:MAG: hypothetical protein WKF83_03135 [Nocardioidaceae bacterium]